jgi:hypothetical protein
VNLAVPFNGGINGRIGANMKNMAISFSVDLGNPVLL